MNKYIESNTKLNPLIMNNARISKPLFSTLFGRGGLICLLFLLPWFTNLQAQPYYGQVGISRTPGEDRATLNILDDDNSNVDPHSRNRRKIVLVWVQDGNEAGATTPAAFKVAFQNGANGLFCCGGALPTPTTPTTASQDVEVTFQIIDGSATQGTSCATGKDFKTPATLTPATFTKIIRANNNASDTVSLPVCQDNIIEGTENFTVRLISARALVDIPSEVASVATEFDVDANPLTLNIFDDDDASKLITLTRGIAAIDRGSSTGSVITASLPAGYTCSVPLVIQLGTAVGTSGTVTVNDYGFASPTITIPIGQTTVTNMVNALCYPADLTTHTTDKNLVVGGTLTGGLTGWTITPTSNITLNSTGLGNTITSAGGATAICSGSTLTLTAPNTGVGYTYQWYQGAGAGTLIGGATNQDYVVSTSGIYKVIVSKTDGCSRLSSDFAVAVNPLPGVSTISTLSPTEICGTAEAVLTASNLGVVPGLTYQWYHGTTALGSPTAAPQPLTVSGALFGSGIQRFSIATMFATGCTTKSSPIEFNFGSGSSPDKPQIQGSNTMCSGIGSSVTLTAVSTGAPYTNPNYIYKWYLGGSTTPVYTATGSNTYTTSTIGSYTVMVFDGACPSSPSIAHPITISGTGTPAVPIITATNGGVLCAGGSVTLEVTNTYGGSVAIKWYSNMHMGEVGTGRTLTVTDAATYTAVAIDGICQSSATKVVTTSATPAPAKPDISPVTTLAICGATGTVTLKVDAPIAGFTYRWYLDGNKVAEGIDYVSYIASSNGNYYVVAIEAGGCESQHSNTLTVTQPGTGSTPATPVLDKTAASYCAGGDVTLSVTTTYTGTVISYRWFHEYGLPLSETSANLTISATGRYRVVAIVDGCESQPSAWTTVSQTGTTTMVKPTIGVVGGGAFEFCIGGAVSLTVTNASDPSLAGATFKWYRDGVGGSIGTGLTYAASVQDNYTVVAVSGTCQKSSNKQQVNQGTATANLDQPILKMVPASGKLCTGGANPSSVDIYAYKQDNTTLYNVSGITFRWYKDEVLMPGKTAYMITVTAAGSYRAEAVQGSCQSLRSAIASVTEDSGNSAPAAPAISPISSTLCTGGTVTLTATPLVIGNVYQWYRDGLPVSGVESLTSGTYITSTGGVYTAVLVQGTCRSVPSNTATVNIGTGMAPKQPEITASNSGTACASGSVALHAVEKAGASGDSYTSSTTFIWYKGGVAVPGATTAYYFPAEPVGTYTYTVIAVGSCGQSALSAPQSVTFSASGTTPTQPKIIASNSGIICGVGGSVELKAVRNDNSLDYVAGFTYEWYKNGTTLVATTTSNIYFPTETAVGTYTYTVRVVSGTCGSLISAGQPVTVNAGTAVAAPVIKSVDTPATVCANNGTTTLYVDSPNSATYTYKWYRKHGINSEGTGVSIAVSEPDTYYAIAIKKADNCESKPSNDIDVISSGGTNSMPKPDLNTATATFCKGGSTTITITNAAAYAPTVTFQWNGISQGVITGETGSSLVVTVADTYWVVARDGSCQSEKSNEKPVVESATVNTVVQPQIGTDNDVRDICTNGSITIKVTNLSSYTSGETFQWFNSKGLITGATQATYIATKAETYYVVAIGACQSLPSTKITLTQTGANSALVAPVITADPTNAEMCIGGSVKLTATPSSGTYPTTGITYRWYIDGVEDGSYNGPVFTATKVGKYKVVVVDVNCQSLPSAEMNVLPGTTNAPGLPTINTSGGTSFCTGGSVTLTAVPAAAGTYTYEWYLNGAPIPGAIGISYQASVAGLYSVIVIDAPCRSVRSADVSVTDGGGVALAKPGIIAVNGVFSFCSGGSVELKAQSTGAAYPAGTTYEWYLNGTRISGVNVSVHHATVAGSYTVVATNGCPSVLSDAEPVSQSGGPAPVQPQIAVDPASQAICQSGSIKLTATPTSGSYTGIAAYKWYKNGNEVAQTTVNIYHALWAVGDTYPVAYTVKVISTGGCESKVSAPANISQSANTAPAQPVIDQTSPVICINGMVTLTVSNVTGTKYEWYRDGVWVKDTFVPSCNATQTGKYYVVVVDGSCRSVPSAEVTVGSTGSTAPGAPTMAAAAPTICTNGSVQLTATPTGYPSYLWFKDGGLVATTTENVYPATTAGSYTVAVKDGLNCISKESTPPAVLTPSAGTALDKPAITSPSTELCAGLNLELTATSGATSYTWYRSGTGVVATTLTNKYVATQVGSYTVVANTSGCSSMPSDAAVITASTDPNCVASRIRLSVDANEVMEGVGTNVRATLLDGYVAQTNMTINLSFTGSTADKGACVPGNGHNDFDILTTIIIPANGTTGSTSLSTCADLVYEGDETVIIAATYNSTPILDSPKTVTIKDADADTDGKLRVKWELQPTGSAAGTYAVFKGEPAPYKAIAVNQSGTPISVQSNQTVTLQYSGSTATAGTHYTPIVNATILANTSSVSVVLTTVDDHMADPDLHVLSNIVGTALHGVVSAVQDLTIKSACSNTSGGVDIALTLTPATLVEGNSFTLTASIDGTSCLAGEDVVLDLREKAGSVARRTVDYNMPATITIPRGAASASVTITTVDNNLYDGDRRMDIEAIPVYSKNVVTTMTPSPLSGMIQDNDKPCITITSDKKGVDESDKIATIHVAVNNLTPTSPAVVLQLANTGGATHYTTNMPATITFTAADSTEDFIATSTLIVPNPDRSTFDIKTYITTYEELIWNIGAVNSPRGVDCFNPLMVIISDDFDRDGLPNWYERIDPNTPSKNCTPDTNNNGIPNEWDPYNPNADDDGDGIPNWKEDTNGDGNPYNDFAKPDNCAANFANPDSDGDGVPDSVEKWTDRTFDNNDGDIRIHPALSFNDDAVGNDFLFIENINLYPDNEVTVFDRQGIVVYQIRSYNNTDKSFRGIPNKGRLSKKIAMGTYFVVVDYSKAGVKKRYSKAVEVRY